jgi:hypothetical protein
VVSKDHWRIDAGGKTIGMNFWPADRESVPIPGKRAAILRTLSMVSPSAARAWDAGWERNATEAPPAAIRKRCRLCKTGWSDAICTCILHDCLLADILVGHACMEVENEASGCAPYTIANAIDMKSLSLLNVILCPVSCLF